MLLIRIAGWLIMACTLVVIAAKFAHVGAFGIALCFFVAALLAGFKTVYRA